LTLTPHTGKRASSDNQHFKKNYLRDPERLEVRQSSVVCRQVVVSLSCDKVSGQSDVSAKKNELQQSVTQHPCDNRHNQIFSIQLGKFLIFAKSGARE
jgi:hypothetical protein